MKQFVPLKKEKKEEFFVSTKFPSHLLPFFETLIPYYKKASITQRITWHIIPSKKEIKFLRKKTSKHVLNIERFTSNTIPA